MTGYMALRNTREEPGTTPVTRMDGFTGSTSGSMCSNDENEPFSLNKWFRLAIWWWQRDQAHTSVVTCQ